MAEKIVRVIDYSQELVLLREGDRSPELFAKIIEKARPRLELIEKLHDRYSQDYVPVLNDREVLDAMEIDNRIANDYFGEIVDTKVGYFSGNPMTFAFEDGADSVQDYFNLVATRNRLDDINSETTKHCAIGGYAARVVYTKKYINAEGKEDTIEGVRQVPPWQVICLSEDGIDEPEFAIRFFTVIADDKEQIHLEFYEPYKTTTYIGEDIEKLSEADTLSHDIGVCNLFCYENNAELQGDAEKILTLIDDMDRVMSDRSSELEAYRSAYLVFFGVDPDSVDEAKLSRSGALYFKNNTDCNQSAQFVTKELPHEALEAHANRIEDNIYRFSKTPNMNEKKTGIAVSGLALQQRMLPMENKTSSFERKFVSGNIRMLECFKYTFAARGFDFDPYKVEQSFTRNTPDDFEYEAEVLERLLEVMPPEKAYALTSFAKDHKELAKWYKEKQQKETDAYDLGVDMNGQDGLISGGIGEVSKQEE